MQILFNSLKQRKFWNFSSYLVLPIFVLLFCFSLLSLPQKASAAIIIKAPSQLGTSSGLVGYWKFDEGSGTKVLDSSGNSNIGTITGATWASGKLGKALNFNGVNDYVAYSSNDVPNSFFTSGFTISAWIKPNSIGETQGRILDRTTSTGINDGFSYRVSSTDNCLQLSVAGGTNIYSDIGSITFGEWQHVLVTVASNALVTHYINGIVSGTPGLTSSLSGIDTTNYLCIGNRGGVSTCNTDRSFDGLIDDVRIYNRALSAGEVQRLYNAGASKVKTPSRTGLIGHWKFDEGSGTKVNDSSGRGNAGTITGATWASGKNGKALSFDGDDDYVLINNGSSFAPNASTTYCTWIKMGDNNSTSESFIYFSTATYPRVHITTSTSKPIIYLGSSNYRYFSYPNDFDVLDKNWHHVCFLLTGTGQTDILNSKMWFDGIDASPSGTPTTSGSPNSFISFSIGGEPGTSFINALIDDVRIYNRELSTAEIQDIYQSGAMKVNSSSVGKLSDGLVGHWTFDGRDLNGTTAYDRSPVGTNTGTISGAVTAIGKMGQALKFDGVNDYISVSYNSSLELPDAGGSVSCWFKISSKSGQDSRIGLVRKAINSNWVAYGGYFLYLYQNLSTSDPFLIADLGSDNNVDRLLSTKTHILLDKWYFATMVWDSNKLRMYLNGEEEASMDRTKSLVWAGTQPLRVGYPQGGKGASGDYIKGLMDDVRIYNRALSAEEVKDLYNLGR